MWFYACMTTTKAKTKKTAYKVYEMIHKGVTYEIDGQNHELDSKEWQVFEVTSNGRDWWETLPTKRDAIEYVLNRF